jgi:hypothetical protein
VAVTIKRSSVAMTVSATRDAFAANSRFAIADVEPSTDPSISQGCNACAFVDKRASRHVELKDRLKMSIQPRYGGLWLVRPGSRAATRPRLAA